MVSPSLPGMSCFNRSEALSVRVTLETKRAVAALITLAARVTTCNACSCQTIGVIQLAYVDFKLRCSTVGVVHTIIDLGLYLQVVVRVEDSHPAL